MLPALLCSISDSICDNHDNNSNKCQVTKIDSWPGRPKSIFQQPVITAPVIQQTKTETASASLMVDIRRSNQSCNINHQHTNYPNTSETAVCDSAIFVCWMTCETGCYEVGLQSPGQGLILLTWLG